mgnify:CR=1 FL=1
MQFLVLEVGVLVTCVYLIRILVHSIPNPLDGLYGFDASKVKELNGGVLDTTYRINWPDYRNCILLTKGSELKRVNTKLFRIEELDR